MRKQKLFALTASLCGAAVIMFSSCTAVMGPDFTKQKDVDDVVMKRITKHLDPETIVFNLDFRDTGDFTTRLSNAVVTYWADGEVKSTLIPLSGNQKPNDTKPSGRLASRTEDSGMKLADLDLSRIASNIEKAVEIMNEDEELPLDGIEYYSIKVGTSNAETTHNFMLESKENTELNSGGRLVTNYWKIEFEADAEGNVEWID